MDRVDAGFSIRLRDPDVRRDEQHSTSRTWPHTHTRSDGAARHAYRRARSWVQQSLDVWQPPPPHARRPHPARCLGERLLRDGDQSERRRAGSALVEHVRRPGIRLQLQRPALPVRRYDAHDSHHGHGQVLMGENDAKINLLDRAVTHALATAKYICFDGTSEHAYDVRGRTAHEALFNRNDGRFRARSTQQGYSPFSTWTRGLAWA